MILSFSNSRKLDVNTFCVQGIALFNSENLFVPFNNSLTTNIFIFVPKICKDTATSQGNNSFSIKDF